MIQRFAINNCILPSVVESERLAVDCLSEEPLSPESTEPDVLSPGTPEPPFTPRHPALS